MARIKGLYIATLAIKLDFDGSKSDMSFEEMKRVITSEDLTSEIKKVVMNEIMDERMGMADVTPVYADLWEVDENESEAVQRT